jgi:hypothetical protein
MSLFWAPRAKKAREEGYQPGNHLENSLKRHLEQFCPNLLQGLGQERESYLQVQVNDYLENLEEQRRLGVPTEVAQELAQEELFPPAEQEEKPEAEDWELEAAQADMEAAALKFLLRDSEEST